jgi:hypothetical protein
VDDSEIRLETIAFAPHNAAALKMRLDDGTAPLVTPEWVRADPNGPAKLADGRNHPVALVASLVGGTLAVEATFSVADARPSALIKPQLAPVLREMFAARFVLPKAPVQVDFVNGVGRGMWHFDLTPHGVELADLAIQWKEVVVANGKTTQLDIDVSEHEVAITLDVPAAPWQPGTGPLENHPDLTVPWWDVIRRACLFAVRATTAADIATRITEAVHRRRLGGVYWWRPSNDYSSTPGTVDPPYFDCAGFLRLLRGEDVPSSVDCSDMTAVVLTFANAIGGRLSPCFIGMSGSSTRKVTLVGFANADEQQFGLHEFATAVVPAAGKRVWDACLELGDATKGPTTLPSGIDEADYLAGLLPQPPRQLACEPHAAFRPIRPAPADLTVVSLERSGLQRFAEFYRFKEWAGGRLLEPSMDRRERFVEGRSSDPTRLVAIDIYHSKSVAAARLRLLALLARLHPARLRRVQPSQPGIDIEFRSDDFAIIVASGGQGSVLVRGASSRTSLSDVRQFYRQFRSRMH